MSAFIKGQLSEAKTTIISVSLPQNANDIKIVFFRMIGMLKWNLFVNITEQRMKFSIKDFFSKSDQILSFLRIWSYLLTKSLRILTGKKHSKIKLQHLRKIRI